MDKKKLIYIGLLLILTVIVSITYFSYAFFTHRDEQHGKLNIVTGMLDYKIESNDLVNNSITLEAKKSKQIEIEITSLNSISSKYELYYTTTASNVVIGYSSDDDTPTGTIAANSKKTVKIVIKNKSDSSITINFGVDGGFINNELVLKTGSHITDVIDNICNYENGYVWNFPFDPDGDGQGQEQTFTVSCDGTYRIELWGASGGAGTSVGNPSSGDLAGYTSGTIDLYNNNILYVYVGQKGKDYPSGSGGGYNGGGNGNNVYSSLYAGGGGGGATDIRYNGNSLNDRIMVSGGGNGARNSGISGGLTSQTSGYQFGIGQNYLESAAGGGAGGYYGSTQSNASGNNTTNIGASSYISGHTGCVAIQEGSSSEPRTVKKSGCSTGTTDNECSIHYSGLYFTDTKMIDGAGYSWTNVKASLEQMPNPNGGYYASGTGHTGNGHARITYLGE